MEYEVSALRSFLEPDAKLDEYREVRAALNERVKEVMATAEQPGVVADVVLKAAGAARPKLWMPKSETESSNSFCLIAYRSFWATMWQES